MSTFSRPVRGQRRWLAATLFVALAGFAGGAGAKPEVSEKGLPPGLSVSEAKKLSARIDEISEKELEKQERKNKAKREKLEEATRPYVASLERALDKNPKLKQRIKKAEKKIEALSKDESLSDDQRRQQMEALAAEIEPDVNQVLQEAEFDGEAFRKTVEDALEVPEQARGVRKRALRTISSYYYISPYYYSPPPPSEVEKVLSPPYPETVERQRGPGSQWQQPGEPSYRAYSSTWIIGYYTNESGLGHFEEVPAGGYTRFRVDAEIPQATTSLMAMSLSPGWNSARIRTRVEVMAQNKIICRDYVDHGSIWTIWGHVSNYGGEPIVVYCEGDAPPAGEKIVVRYVTESTVGVTVVGSALAAGTINPSEIRIKFMK